ncbi:MAG TPA: glucose-6-phosphate isomerase [Candidatus Limnocylindria bacterium]|nr:glucose-6-phosphate isomerase [Candidatus Limnocylindria bacterium]
MGARIRISLPATEQAAFDDLVARATDEQWPERLFDRDPALWTDDPDVAAGIADRLGWLDAPAHFTEQSAALEGFSDGAVETGFDQAVVMGMGGSSLAPDVLHRTFGTTEGYLDLRILDSTDPAAVAAAVDDLDPLETLWIVASKSGTTTEPLAFMADAWARVDAALDERGSDQNPGEFFAVITDPGKSLEAIPHQDDLRERFLNPPDVGGRYSALTYVGLVPASLIGLDVDALLAAGSAMLAACREPNAAANPGVELGLAIGSLAAGGRDKLTFLTSPDIAGFGAWAEQLIAESTGKHGVGIVPVDLEPLRDAADYGPDRAFAVLTVAGGAGVSLADELERAGQPVIRIELDDPIDIAGEMLRWEVATAIAGAVLGIDPFDQPNVEDAKERTRRVLAGVTGDGTAVDPGGAEIEPGGDGGIHVAAHDAPSLADLLRPTIAALAPPSYVAVQAFIAPSTDVDAAIAGIRTELARTACATTAGYGPRFLHSTGQLHKGGPATGVFLQLTSDHPVDREIPGWPYTFGRLIDAQARGDREALRAGDRPVIHVHLGANLAADLETLRRAIGLALT